MNQTIKKKQTQKVLGIVGYGNMANAIVTGLLKSKTWPKSHMRIYTHKSSRVAALTKETGIKTTNDLQEFTKNSDVILLAIKPQVMSCFLKELNPFLKNQLIITVAAGLTLKTYKNYLPQKIKIIRAMPNTPLLIGQGITGLVTESSTPQLAKQIADSIFAASGQTVWLSSENKMNALTALSGSGPAFLFQFAENLVQAGVHQGLSKKQAEQLVKQTLLGASSLLTASNQPIPKLIAQVASKKGMTEKGLESLKKSGFTHVVQNCIKATVKRGEQLAKSLS